MIRTGRWLCLERVNLFAFFTRDNNVSLLAALSVERFNRAQCFIRMRDYRVSLTKNHLTYTDNTSLQRGGVNSSRTNLKYFSSQSRRYYHRGKFYPGKFEGYKICEKMRVLFIINLIAVKCGKALRGFLHRGWNKRKNNALIRTEWYMIPAIFRNVGRRLYSELGTFSE